jgi:UDP-glucose 4-epimerase
MSTLNVAIVGSNGFIGRNLAKLLIQDPEIELFLYGKNKTSVFGDDLPYVKIDLLNTVQINKYFAHIDLIYYLASETIPSSSWENPLLELEKNLKPFIQFTETVCKLQTKKMVFLSSAGTVYGATNQKASENTVPNPFSPYGIIKLTMEHFLNHFQAKHGLAFDIYRVSNVYGDGQDTTKGLGIINTFIEKILTENRVTVYGKGESVRNYVYVKDIAQILKTSLIADIKKSAVYNLASNDTVSINELIALLKKVVAEKFEVNYIETRQSDNSIIDPDNAKISKAHPKFKFLPLLDGLKLTYDYLKTH